MKQAEVKGLRLKNLKDLVKKFQELKKELAEILIEASLGKNKNSHKTRAKRKDIAQILTLINQKRFELQLSEVKKTEQRKEKIA